MAGAAAHRRPHTGSFCTLPAGRLPGRTPGFDQSSTRPLHCQYLKAWCPQRQAFRRPGLHPRRRRHPVSGHLPGKPRLNSPPTAKPLKSPSARTPASPSWQSSSTRPPRRRRRSRLRPTTFCPDSFAEARLAMSVLQPLHQAGNCTNQFLADLRPRAIPLRRAIRRAPSAPRSPLSSTASPHPSMNGSAAPARTASRNSTPQVALSHRPRSRCHLLRSPQRPRARNLHLHARPPTISTASSTPATQMPPPDEDHAPTRRIRRPRRHQRAAPTPTPPGSTIIGVPAVVVPGGFYPDGPCGRPALRPRDLSARPWRDGDLLGYAYAYEQATHLRHAPILVESGLLPTQP